MSFTAGHYTATWNSASIGETENGFRLQAINHHEPIVTDDFGDVPVDGVVRGTEYRLMLDWVDYEAIDAVLFAQADTAGACKSNVGKLLSGLAKELILTAVSGTPAADGSIYTLTATLAIVVTDFEVLLASRLRKGPCTFQLLPDPNSSNKAFTIAAAA